MKNKGTKQKSKKKGSENAFGCDLTEHLQSSGQDVPQVLQKCAEFIEKHGVVDGIYRLSGVTSNIQRLRQEFCSEACPDLTKEVYLQDIHCVGSLCKLYFRELPNPLLTYELYSKFTDAVSVHGDHERLLHIQRVIKELPTPHFRTLEFLTKHLTHLATLSSKTNMHTRNLALVWAPNLLRSKAIEVSSGNGDMAFQEVRIQQSVVEFILNNTEQIFNGDSVQIKPKEGSNLMCGEKYATLPISGQCGPMKLMSLEEAQARSLSPNHPVHKERQRENSLPDTSTATLYHTVIDLSDSKRKFSGKSKKWKSIFNLGRSVDSKGKLSRNGSVFIRAPGITEKAALRPSRSMESLCSLPADEHRTGSSSPAGGPGSIYSPDVKSRTLGSDSLYDLSEHDQNWEIKGKKSGGATGGWSSGTSQKGTSGASATPQKTLPEQLKVFKGDDLSGYQPTSPKNRRMLYSGSSHSSSSRPSFPGSFFPLESSPRHQRRAVNISEPFAVSVPLRVSAVISSNSTPIRALSKDKAVAATLKPCRDTSEQSSNGGKNNTPPQPDPSKTDGTEKTFTEEPTSPVPLEGTSKSQEIESRDEINSPEVKQPALADSGEGRDATPPPGKHNQPAAVQQEKQSSDMTELWCDLQELKITEPDIDLLDETFKPVLNSKSSCENVKLTMDVKSKRSRSSPSLSLLCREPPTNTSLSDWVVATGADSAKKQPSESDIVFSLQKNWDVAAGGNVHPALEDKDKHQLPPVIPPLKREDEADADQRRRPLEETCLPEGQPPSAEAPEAEDNPSKSPNPTTDEGHKHDGAKKLVIPEVDVVHRLSVCLEERRRTLELPIFDDEEGCGGNPEELDLVEPWEELSSTKQWVTSPLHSPDVEALFHQLSPFISPEETLSSEEGKSSSLLINTQATKSSVFKGAERSSGNIPHSSRSNAETKWTYLPTVPSRVSVTSNAAQAPTGKCSTTKQKSSQRFYRQMSYEAAASDKRDEQSSSKHRPCSLNLDLGQRCIRDISNQQRSPEFPSCQRGPLTSSGAVNNGLLSELELFLNDRQAPLRRNSAPVSVSSVRTAFMIKTSQAKAVPVVPPKVQYSQIPHSRNEKDAVKEQEKDGPKTSTDKSNVTPPLVMSDLKEELENKEPPKPDESARITSNPELPVITRRHPPSLEVFVDCPRPNKANLLQRPSFRNRQRPQSLILLTPPFPIMDYPPSGDDSRLLSSIKSLNEAPAVNVFSREVSDNFRTPESLQNKMTIPKSGQRLETSTSCFYQPQRRSMIFDSRSSHRQIE